LLGGQLPCYFISIEYKWGTGSLRRMTMLEKEGAALRAIRWSEIFPWLGIGRCFRLAISPRLLTFGAASLLLTLAGWSAIADLFKRDVKDFSGGSWRAAFGNRSAWDVIDQGVPERPFTLHAYPPVASRLSDEGSPPALMSMSRVASEMSPTPITCVWYSLTRPVLRLFSLGSLGASESDRPMPARDFISTILSCFWSLAVWSYFGAAISRVAAVELAVGEWVGWAASLRWVRGKWLAYFAAPLVPMVGVALAAAPIMLLGLCMKISFFAAVAGLIWPLALAAACVMALLLVGVLLGWPLMWGTISVEGTDSFDAISRTYAYVLQRPVRYLSYVLVAAIVGWLGWIVVENFAAAVIWLAAWAASWGAAPRSDELLRKLGDTSHVGAWLATFWNGCVKLLALGYLFSYFGVASTAIYYQMRRDIDAREIDEVFLDADKSERSFGLPQLLKDAAGAPEVAGSDTVE
jgi:hypothetical protein